MTKAARGIEGDIAVLETDLRKLEFEYDQFLSGQARALPMRREKSVQDMIRSYGGRAIQNPALRFRYANLVARYNSLKRVWDRRIREMEEGRTVGRPRRAAAPPRRHEAGAAAGDKAFVASDLRGDASCMKQIFENYRSLRKECGEPTERLRLENFTNILADKVEKLKKARGCDKVEIHVRRESGKCRIMVRPLKGGGAGGKK